MDITVDSGSSFAVGKLPFELVERKGLGHPDTLCDAIAERASRAYAQHCEKTFGGVAHHWFDKVFLLGGESRIEFGYGALVKPITVVICGKAAVNVGGQDIPLHDLFAEASRSVLGSILTDFDPQQHLKLEVRVGDYKGPGQQSSRYRPSSVDELVKLPAVGAVSNDCNLCVGYAQLSRLELLVLRSERLLNAPSFKHDYPELGSDIKVFGVRSGSHVTLTLNLPFIASRTRNRAQYLERQENIRETLTRFLEDDDLTVTSNPEDASGRSYLTVTGTVADTGDIGAVGRGNRINGLISPLRPMSIEAAAGKNPIDHTGKLYGILANRLAATISNQVKASALVSIFTTKGRPLVDPDHLSVMLDSSFDDGTRASVMELGRTAVAKVSELSCELIREGIDLW